MPVKGFVFGTGEMNEFVTRETFNITSGEGIAIEIRATASNNSANGTYLGDILVFSSPFWMMYPDGFIEYLYSLNAEATVLTLDVLTALILSGLTILLLVSITIIGDTITNVRIDHSWNHPAHIFFKKSIIGRLKTLRKKASKSLKYAIGWVLNIEYKNAESKELFFSDYGKPLVASLVIIPLLFMITDSMLAMALSIAVGSVIAYSLSCKIRKKIVLTVMIIMIFSMVFMILQSNIIIFQKDVEFLEMIALSFGIIGVYLLIFTLLLLPFSALAWYITRAIRNVKEQKDPLLSLEGSCDL